MPDFSTTTSTDKIAGGILLMGGLQKYFGYKMCFSCGIPKVTLEGTLQDWIRVREKASRLAWFKGDVAKWAELLLPVLDQFIASYEGKVDLDFWERIATSERKGSGGEIDISGWLLVFAPFNDKGVYQLFTPEQVKETRAYGKVFQKDLPDVALHVPVIIDDNGKKVPTVFYGGVIQPQYDKEKNEVRPSVGWAVIQNDPEEAKKRAKEPSYD
jgi:hypothetical protein